MGPLGSPAQGTSDPLNLADIERLAEGAIARDVWDFIAGGAEDEVTLRRNEVQFGENIRALSEFYQPLETGGNIFVAPAVQYLSLPINQFQSEFIETSHESPPSEASRDSMHLRRDNLVR